MLNQGQEEESWGSDKTQERWHIVWPLTNEGVFAK